VLGAEQVARYSICWQLFTIPNLLQSVAFSYLWAAYAEAIVRGDSAWVLRALRLSLALGTGIALVLSLPLLAFGSTLIRIWAGPAAVPSMAVFAWMSAWAVVLAPANAMVCLLNAAGRVRWQVPIALVTAAANLGTSIWWAGKFGIAGVIAATVVTYLALSVVPLIVVGRRFVRELGAGV